MTEMRLLSNGRYHVPVTATGGGYSRWQDLALTRWREHAALDHWGVAADVYAFLPHAGRGGGTWYTGSSGLDVSADHRVAGRSDASRGAEMYELILVPIDGSVTSNAGLVEATKLAKLVGARLRLLHVADEMPFVMAAGGFGAMTVDVFATLQNAGKSVATAA